MPELDPFTARATLEWLIEMGCDEAIGERPVNRYALPDRQPVPEPPAPPPEVDMPVTADAAPATDAVAEADRRAAAAASLAELHDAILGYPYCDLRLGAASTVFAAGDPSARVMIIGDAPGREEDRAGHPFAGASGALLDRMLAAIGLARDGEGAAGVYLASVLPWRLPSDRAPEPDEMAMMLPFLRRHVELAAPEILVLMGNQPCGAVLGRRGLTRLRGIWTEGFGRPALPMLPPAYLMRNPGAKREAWADLLELAARLGP